MVTSTHVSTFLNVMGEPITYMGDVNEWVFDAVCNGDLAAVQDAVADGASVRGARSDEGEEHVGGFEPIANESKPVHIKEIKLPNAKQTHEVCYEPKTQCVFVSQMSSCVC